MYLILSPYLILGFLNWISISLSLGVWIQAHDASYCNWSPDERTWIHKVINNYVNKNRGNKLEKKLNNTFLPLESYCLKKQHNFASSAEAALE